MTIDVYLPISKLKARCVKIKTAARSNISSYFEDFEEDAANFDSDAHFSGDVAVDGKK